MSHTAITSKFKMRWFPNEGRLRAGKLQTGANLVPLMPDRDKTISGSEIYEHVLLSMWFSTISFLVTF